MLNLQKQMLNCVHRLPPVERHAAEALNALCGQIGPARTGSALTIVNAGAIQYPDPARARSVAVGASPARAGAVEGADMVIGRRHKPKPGHAAGKARTARADAWAAELRPTIEPLQASGVTSLRGIAGRRAEGCLP
jgi:hypothetical protein